MLMNALKFFGVFILLAFLLYLAVRLASYAIYKSKREINNKN